MPYTIATILDKTKSKALLCSSKDKVYKFTNSDYPLDFEYIYIPMVLDKAYLFEKIKLHLKNPNCKGFFINEADTKTEQYLKILFEYRPENVFSARNVYNTGFKVANLIANSLDFNLLILAGTDELNEANKKLCLNLNIPYLKYDELIHLP